MTSRREHLVNVAVNHFLGLNDHDGSYTAILDTYNSYLPHPRGYMVGKKDAWGCIFASAMAIYLPKSPTVSRWENTLIGSSICG